MKTLIESFSGLKYLLVIPLLAYMMIFLNSCQDNVECELSSYDEPRFPGCEDLDPCEIEDCSNQKLYYYIYAELHYPSYARENGIEGLVKIQFFIEKDGFISDITIIKDIGGGCGEAAVKAIESMNMMDEMWIPGTQNGDPVKKNYILPITFKLTG